MLHVFIMLLSSPEHSCKIKHCQCPAAKIDTFEFLHRHAIKKIIKNKATL